MKSPVLRLLRRLTLSATLLLSVVPAAHASFVAYICNDVNCDGSGDMSVTDNLVGDAAITPGVISFNFTTGGVTVTVNTSVSNSARNVNPLLNMSYTVVGGSGPGEVWLYASDTDFTRIGTVTGIFNSSANPVSTGFALYGGNDNTNNGGPYPLDLSSVLFNFGATTGTNTFVGTAGAPSLLTNPYFLTAGVDVKMSGFGVSSGDVTVTIPDPNSVALLGLGLLGLFFLRRGKTGI